MQARVLCGYPAIKYAAHRAFPCVYACSSVMRSLATLLLLAGIVAITIGYTKTTATCPPPRVEYRYVPRKYLDEQMDSSSASEVMTDMATTATPYNDSVYDSAARGSMYAAVGATTEMK